MYLGRWKTQQAEGYQSSGFITDQTGTPPNLEGSKVSCATQPRECCGKTRLCSVPNCAFTWKKRIKKKHPDWRGKRFLKKCRWIRVYSICVYISALYLFWMWIHMYIYKYKDLFRYAYSLLNNYIGICVFVGEKYIYMIIYIYTSYHSISTGEGAKVQICVSFHLCYPL